MLHRGELFLRKLKEARGKVSKSAVGFIVDGSVSAFLIHLTSVAFYYENKIF